MWIRTHGIVPARNHGRKRIRDIARLDNVSRPSDLQTQQQERQQDASREQVLVYIERQLAKQLQLDSRLWHERVLVRVGQQIGCGKDVGAINEDATDDGCKDKHVRKLCPARVVNKVVHVDKVKLVILNDLTFPVGTHVGRSVVMLAGGGCSVAVLVAGVLQGKTG